MKTLLTFAVVLLLLPATLRAEHHEEGWIIMFDGESLKGWEANERDDWQVVDGTIKTPPGRSHLYYTDAEFTDFELVAEVKTTPGSNSGIFFHTKWQDSGWPAHGYESQVNQTQGDPVKSGSIYNVIKLYDSPAEDNQWYEHRIKVEGKNIRIHVNGKLVIDFTEPEGVTGTRRLQAEGGHIALQGHDPDSVVYYRNIKIRPLTKE